MRQSVVDLIEAVRALRLTVVDRGPDRGVKVGVALPDFQAKLLDLADALAAVDADGAAAADGKLDPIKLRAALDATFRWIQVQGLSIAEPMAAVAEIVGAGEAVETAKAKKAFTLMPAFAHGHRKKKSWKPTLTLDVQRLGAMRTIDDHVKASRDMEETYLKMGGVAPQEAFPDEPSAGMGF